jgi:hypothetical protein
MPVGDIISATDYNTIRTKIINVMSTGAGNTGYGQNTFSSLVSSGNSVTKAQWDLLRYDIYNAVLHQTGSAPAITTVAVGDVIRYGAANPNFQYNTLADQAISNRFDLGTGQFVTEGIGSTTFTSSWASSVSCTATINFNTAEQARFFFNAGGKIRFSSSRTGGNSEAQNSAWSNLLATAGTQSFGGNSPAINFFNLTNSFQQFYSLSASSPYSANRWKLEASCNVPNNSAGTASIVTFRITWVDDYVDSSGPFVPPGDLVDGTLSLVVDSVRAYGVLQPTGTAGSFNSPGPILSPTPGASSVGAISGS